MLEGPPSTVPSSTGGPEPKKGNDLAARTDDIPAIIEAQFEGMEPGPKLIMGDLNGALEAFPTAVALIKEHGWTDIGNDETKCQGKPGKATCKTNKDATESRIDFILANSRLTPAITTCYVDESSDYPTHRPLIIEIVTKLLENTSRELKKPTNFAKMFTQKIEDEIEEAAVKREEEKENGNDNFEGEQEHSIGQRNIEALHREMDQAVDKRKHRLDYAVKLRDTNTQWDLIAAAVEEGVVGFFQTTGKGSHQDERAIQDHL